MGLAKFKPTSEGKRHKVILDFEQIKDGTTSKEKKERKKAVRFLHVKIKKHSGRNNQGRITSRFRGGGAKPIYRKIDFFRRDKEGIVGRVDYIEYDPNRNCFIALVVYTDGEKRYIIAPKGVKADDRVQSGQASPIKDGNAMPLFAIPMGSAVHNIELTPSKGGQIARAAGQSAQVVAKEKGMVAIKLASGELRWVLDTCYATLGEVCCSEFNNQNHGKAGRRRWLGRKPHQRGSSMNPNDHKHGGGEGKCPIGADGPYTFAGKPHGLKTRKRKKNSDKRIISRRKGNKG